jgi:hypothetical protein
MPVGREIIGILFYLASTARAQLEKETHDLEGARKIIMLLTADLMAHSELIFLRDAGAVSAVWARNLAPSIVRSMVAAHFCGVERRHTGT